MFFFFNDTATTEIYTLSLHDALPISVRFRLCRLCPGRRQRRAAVEPHRRSCPQRKRPTLAQLGARPSGRRRGRAEDLRSEEHTSELQSRLHLVCRLLLEKKT